MPKFLGTIILLFSLWNYHSATSENDSFSDVANNPSDQIFFNKYGHCSVSLSRLNDAYTVEGHLIESILKGYELLGFNKQDKLIAKEFKEFDENITRGLNVSLAIREKENSTETPTNHPINALHFLRRIVFHFNPLFRNIFSADILKKRHFYKDLSTLIDKNIRGKCSCWPTASDLKVAIKNFARIIKVYKVSKTELVKGYLMGNQSIEALALDEIIVLTQEANRNYYYSDVFEWTEILLNTLVSKLNKDQLRNIIRMRASSLFHTNRKSEAISYIEKVIKEKKLDTNLLKRDLSFYKSKLEQVDSAEDTTKQEISDHHDTLCRENTVTLTNNRVRCYYKSIRKGWDRSKVEILNINPPIYKYYGVINENEILRIHNLVRETKIKLDLYTQKGDVKADDQHSSEETIMWDEDYHITKQLSRKISYFTGLETNNHKYNTKLSSSGPFKIVTYGIGGFEDSQVDYLRKDTDDEKRTNVSVFGGDRLATWMYQLSDHIKGGRIIFPKVNISIPMEQGTGLLWFNLLRNGTVNPMSEHVECPLILGTKWTGKKFIHEDGNMFTRKCFKQYRSYF